MSDVSRHAVISWNNGQPHSVVFDDKYYCQENGFDEALYVFCQGNDLTDRWLNHSKYSDSVFTIVETGFGTGLNFLAAWNLWLTYGSKIRQLHFVSIEKFPLSHDDLKQALAFWPGVSSLSQQLINEYQPAPGSFQIIKFSGDARVTLTIVYDDICSALTQIPLHLTNDQIIDAWFLDGFDPKKNPDMWSEFVMSRIGQLSCSGTTIATFTAAGFVRRALQAAGFNMQKAKGYGRKRHMLRGVMN